jgi:L-lactate dehydrogenase (cytochrome)
MPTLPTLERRLARATNLDDLRRLARRRAPRMIFDYVDGGAEEERSLKTSVTAFDRVDYHPRALQDVSEVSAATEIFGREVSLPLVLGPTGFTRMMHHEGEAAVAKAWTSSS